MHKKNFKRKNSKSYRLVKWGVKRKGASRIPALLVIWNKKKKDS